jgi:hypothetical protein
MADQPRLLLTVITAAPYKVGAEAFQNPLPLPLVVEEFPYTLEFGIVSGWTGAAGKWTVTASPLDGEGNPAFVLGQEEIELKSSDDVYWQAFGSPVTYSGPGSTWLRLDLEGQEVARHEIRLVARQTTDEAEEAHEHDDDEAHEHDEDEPHEHDE